MDPNDQHPALFFLRGDKGVDGPAQVAPIESQGKVLSFLKEHCASVAAVFDTVKQAVKDSNAAIKKAKEEAAAAVKAYEDKLSTLPKEDISGDGGIVKQVGTVCLLH